VVCDSNREGLVGAALRGRPLVGGSTCSGNQLLPGLSPCTTRLYSHAHASAMGIFLLEPEIRLRRSQR